MTHRRGTGFAGRGLAWILLVSLTACSTSPERHHAPELPLTIERLMMLSLRGPGGVALAAQELRQQHTRWSTLASGETVSERVVLDDGVSLHSIWLAPGLRSYDLMLDAEPCLQTSRAAAITGAGAGQPRISAHLENLGLEFGARRNGVDVTFVSQPSSIDCVRAISVHRKRGD